MKQEKIFLKSHRWKTPGEKREKKKNRRMQITQEDSRCSQALKRSEKRGKGICKRYPSRSLSYLTIDGKVGALIERDTDVVLGRYKLGYDREGTPIIFAKQQDWRVARMLGLLLRLCHVNGSVLNRRPPRGHGIHSRSGYFPRSNA